MARDNGYDFTFGDFYLRDAKDADAAGLLAITNDAETMRYYGEEGSWYADLAAASGEIDWFRGLPQENGMRWVIARKDTDEYAGDIGFFGFDGAARRVELGYKLARAYWGKGVVSAFIGMIVPWGFRERGYNRIEAYVEPGNPGSSKALLKNGFSLEGVLREYEIVRDKPVDLEVYSILRREWDSQAAD
jgi:ribosomal-protein-alanine N-acetyltransferase